MVSLNLENSNGAYKLSLFTAIKFLDPPPNLGRKGFLIDHDVSLISHPQELEVFLTPEVMTYIGKLESSFLQSNGLVAHSEFAGVPKLSSEKVSDLIVGWLRNLQSIILSLWHVKDHSVNFDLGFGSLRDIHGRVAVTSSPLMIQYSNSGGELHPTSWSHDELKEARRFHQEHLRSLIIENPVPELEKLAENGPLHSRLVKGAPRQLRFYYILSGARSETDLGVRIAQFIQAMEILFSTTKGELTYRLCLRIALLLEEEPDEQRRVFKIMKDAYSVRSTVVHGSPLQPKIMRALPELSADLESLVRQIGRRLMNDSSFYELFNLNDQDLEAAFADFVFERKLPDDPRDN